MEHVAFGAFNPRFYGVSMFLTDADRRDTLNRYFEHPDSFPVRANDGSPSLGEISAISAIDHELRHFHDFLLSPFGTIMMGLRMQATINGFQAMKTIQNCPGRFVPVPLIRWMRWDAAMRQKWIDTTGASYGIERTEDVVPIPYVEDPSKSDLQKGLHPVQDGVSHEIRFQQYALTAAQAFVSMDKCRQRSFSEYNLDVTADNIFEATAHLVQLQAVWTGQDEASSKLFFHFVMNSQSKQLKPLQILWMALQKSITVTRALELCTWMLLGSYEQIWSRGHPANRYLQVLTLAAAAPDHEIFSLPMPALQLFARLDALMQAGAWSDNLAAAALSADRRSSVYARAAETLKGGFFDTLFSVATVWYSDQRAVRATFAKDPESFVNPLRYLNERCYPIPLVETRFGDDVHEREDSLDNLNARAITIDDQDRQVLSYIVRLKSDRTAHDLDDAFSARIVTHMVDFLFTDEPVTDLYEHWCRSQAKKLINKELISVY
jgi:hypothetical protein